MARVPTMAEEDAKRPVPMERVPKVRFAADSLLEGAVHCELVSEVKIPAPVTKLGADSGRVMG